MATKDTMSEDDDGPEDQGGQQQQDRSDAPVVRPVNETPLIQRAERETEKTEYEILEIGDDGKPLGVQATDDAGDQDQDQDRGREGNLSEQEGGERSFVDQRRSDNAAARRNGQRETHAQRRARARAAREKDRSENADLRKQVDSLANELSQFKTGAEKRLNQADAGRLRGDLTRIEQDITRQDEIRRSAEVKIKEAMAANDGDAFVAAQNVRDEAVIAKTRLETNRDTLKTRLDGGGRQQRDENDDDYRDNRGGDRRQDADADRQRQQPQRPAPLTGVAKRYAEDFIAKHDWMKDARTDPDVRRDVARVRFLDDEVMNEGFKPNTPEYWEELEERMREFLPHVFEDEVEDEGRGARRTNGNDQRANGRGNGHANGNGNGRAPNGQQTQQRRGGPPVAGVGGGGGGRKTVQVQLTAERKRAMIEAGSLTADGRIADHAKFERTLAKFAEYDRAQPGGR